jgi:hypothetical protein
MNTTAAALQANVTVATIRTWCRCGVVAAVKQAGRWIIDTASLAHRIRIGKERRMSRPHLPVIPTNRTRTRGAFGVRGETNALRAAFETGTPVTITSGDFAGERVYLGHRRQTWNDGVAVETVGLDAELGESPKFPGVRVACYLVDTSRLDDAPKFAEVVRKVNNQRTAAAMAAEQRALDEDERWEREGDH